MKLQKRMHFLSAAVGMCSLILLEKGSALLKTVLFAARFGADGGAGAFTAGTEPIQLLAAVTAVPVLGSAYLPAFCKVRASSPRDASRFFRSQCRLFGGGSACLALLLAFFAPRIVAWTAPGLADSAEFSLAVRILRVSLPCLPLTALILTATLTLQAKRRPFLAVLPPWISTVTALGILRAGGSLFALAAGITLATAVGAAVGIWLAFRQSSARGKPELHIDAVANTTAGYSPNASSADGGTGGSLSDTNHAEKSTAASLPHAKSTDNATAGKALQEGNRQIFAALRATLPFGWLQPWSAVAVMRAASRTAAGGGLAALSLAEKAVAGGYSLIAIPVTAWIYPALSDANAEKEDCKRHTLEQRSLFAALAVAGVLTALFLLGTPFALGKLLPARPDSAARIAEAVSILAWGLPLSAASCILTRASEAEGKVKNTVASRGVGAVLTALLAGGLGMHLGLGGAALAEVIGQGGTLLTLLALRAYSTERAEGRLAHDPIAVCSE